MSWGNMFNEKGEFTGVDCDDDENQVTNQEPGDGLDAPLSWDNMGSFGRGTSGNKRSSSQHEGNQTFKKQRGGGGGRGGFKAPSSWGDLQYTGDGGGGGGDDSSFSGFSDLSSWDQISGGGVGSTGGGSFGGSNEDGPGSWDQLSSNRGGGRGRGYNNGGNKSNDSWSVGGEKRYRGSADNFGGGTKGYGGRGGGNKFGRGGTSDGGRGGASGSRGGFAGRGFRGGGHGGFTKDAQSLIEKFETYIKFLKNDKAPRQNSIQSLESACIATRCGLKTDYEVEEVHSACNKTIFTAKLSINNIFLARGVGHNKKELKHEVFNKAHDILLKSSTLDINNLKDPGKDLIKAMVEKQLKITAREAKLAGATAQLNKPMLDIMKEVNKELDTVALLCTGLKKLTAFMKGPTQLPENPISMLEQAMISSKCRLQHIYRSETTITNSVVIYDGALFLEETPIARGRNESRKLCKQETYVAAIQALLNKSVNDLIIPVEKDVLDQETIDEDDEPGDMEATTTKENPATKVALTLYQAAILAEQIGATSFSNPNIVVINDCVCNQGLTSMCIFKCCSLTSEECATCDFFIDNVHISTGYGKTKLECVIDAYDNAWETLLSTEPKELLANHRRLAPNETSDPFVLEVVENGASSHMKESNMASLLRHGYKPDSPILSDNVASIIAHASMDNLVIVEPLNCHKDRKRRAFSILQNSATLSGLLLQWTYSPANGNEEQDENNKPETKCVLYLQGNRIAEHAAAVGKVRVRNAAVAEILFKLYQTQDVLRVCKTNMKQTALEYKSVAAEANRLRAQAGEPKPSPITDILMKRKVDRFIIQVIKNKIDSFVPSPSQDELVIGPGLNHIEVNEVHQYALEKRHIFRITKQLGISYLVIQPSMDLKAVVEWLKKTGGGGQYGRFKLVPKSECPTTEKVEAIM